MKVFSIRRLIAATAACAFAGMGLFHAQAVAAGSPSANDVQAAYLFGSQARGTAKPGSDIDVGVLYAQRPAGKLDSEPMLLEGELERALQQPVQVVVLNSAPVDLAIRVLREGELFLENDRRARIRFEVQTRNEFFDLEPILRRYRGLEHANP